MYSSRPLRTVMRSGAGGIVVVVVLVLVLVVVVDEEVDVASSFSVSGVVDAGIVVDVVVADGGPVVGTAVESGGVLVAVGSLVGVDPSGVEVSVPGSGVPACATAPAEITVANTVARSVRRVVIGAHQSDVAAGRHMVVVRTRRRPVAIGPTNRSRVSCAMP